jgi:hypothetical protein
LHFYLSLLYLYKGVKRLKLFETLVLWEEGWD